MGWGRNEGVMGAFRCSKDGGVVGGGVEVDMGGDKVSRWSMGRGLGRNGGEIWVEIESRSKLMFRFGIQCKYEIIDG